MRSIKSAICLLLMAIMALATPAQTYERGALYHLRSVAFGTLAGTDARLSAADAQDEGQH